jgi:hypothetical protein
VKKKSKAALGRSTYPNRSVFSGDTGLHREVSNSRSGKGIEL